MKLFPPRKDSNVRLRDEYPELDSFHEFKKLSSEDLLFVWYYSCKSSDFHGRDHKYKVDNIVVRVFPDGISNEEKTRRLSKKWTEAELAAMEKMSEFNPSVRMEAKVMIDQAFESMRLIVDSSKVEGDMETDEKTKIVSLLTKVTKELPDIIRLKEQGFGIRVNGATDDATGMTFVDEIMQDRD